MNNNIMSTVKVFLSLAIAILSLVLSLYRAKENKKYATKYYVNRRLLLSRLLFTYLLKGISIIMLIGITIYKWDTFIVFYIITPAFIGLNLMVFNTGWMKGAMTFIKGLYYLGLTTISMIQFLLESQDVAELALGFTLSLAIFEVITALSEGHSKMCEAKKELNSKI